MKRNWETNMNDRQKMQALYNELKDKDYADAVPSAQIPILRRLQEKHSRENEQITIST